MRLNRFYINDNLTTNAQLSLDKTVSNHISRVLRLKVGQQIRLFNGDGFDYQCELLETGKTAIVMVLRQQPNNTRSPLKTHLGQGISRTDRMDFSIQKAVEMGVDEITPLLTERVQFRLDKKRLEKKMRHWEGIIISACEQSGRAHLAILNPPQPLNDWLQDGAANQVPTLMLEPEAEHSIKQVLDDWSGDELSTVRLVIGPEGGFSEQELSTAKADCALAQFGPRILRTETAGVAALALLQHYLGDI